MRILIVGASGMLGSALDREFGKRHDIVRASRTKSDVRVDIADPSSIAAMYKRVGRVDAVVSAAGDAYFGPLVGATHDQFMVGMRSKLMGQIDLVLLGFDYVNDGGSFTLTSGITERDPVRQFANASTVNAALGGFVVGASMEMPRGQRINVVSPGLFEEAAEHYEAYFPGHVPVPLRVVVKAFAKSVEGGISGQKIIADR